MTKSTITRERIQRIIRAINSEAYDEEEIREWLSSDEIMELSRMALAAMDSEPYGFTDADRLNEPVPVYRYAQQPVVPDAYVRDERGRMMLNGICEPKIGFGAGWNACRAAMLQAGTLTNEGTIQALNSPVIPDGYVMVPKDLLSELRDWAHPEIEKYCEMWEGRRDSEFPALRKVITDADALLAAAQQEVK